MPTEPQDIVLTGLGLIVLAIILFSIFKGVIRMLLLAIAISSAIAVWIFIQSKGFTFLAFITSSPRPWMVQTAAWACAIFVFAVFYHGMTWFSQLFSWKRGGASIGGISTTILMSALMLWVGTVGVSYYGDIARISYYQELAEAHMQRKAAPPMPWFTRAKHLMRRAKATSWLEKIDPMEDPAQTNLACLVAYGCTLDEAEATRFYNERLANQGIAQPTRFLGLFRDKGLRTLVQEKRFVTLLENERLKTFLQFRNSEEKLRSLM